MCSCGAVHRAGVQQHHLRHVKTAMYPAGQKKLVVNGIKHENMEKYKIGMKAVISGTAFFVLLLEIFSRD